MKILQIVNPVVAFPPQTIGGIERVVQYIIEELVAQGHEVTLMAQNESILPPTVKFIPIGTYHHQKHTVRKVWKHLLFNTYDVIHNHGRLLYFLPEIWSNTPKVHTFHMAEIESPSFLNFFKLKPRKLTLVPCAKWIEKRSKHLPGHWQYVNHGIPAEKYQFVDHKITADSPLIIICRISFGKGVLDAIDIAKKANRKLIIAGQGGDHPHERKWFENVFLKLCDGEQINYVGPVDDIEKQKLLERSLGLLMLSIDLEAFNLTMLEANACGCPVVSYNRYFPPDFIKEGINGYIGENQDEVVKKIALLPSINRLKCREEFEANYTSKTMVNNYLRLYQPTN